jgi:hypothetical protein
MEKRWVNDDKMMVYVFHLAPTYRPVGPKMEYAGVGGGGEEGYKECQ